MATIALATNNDADANANADVTCLDGDWMPEGSGKWSRLLHFFDGDQGWVELIRLSPGTRLGLHRHSGEVHAFNVCGERSLSTGEHVRAGQYVHEPAGNIDWWEAVGASDLIVFVVVMGTVAYLDESGSVNQCVTAGSRREAYLHHCAATGITPDPALVRCAHVV